MVEVDYHKINKKNFLIYTVGYSSLLFLPMCVDLFCCNVAVTDLHVLKGKKLYVSKALSSYTHDIPEHPTNVGK
jgi:hypothetical protein